jgi:hypothetical protein
MNAFRSKISENFNDGALGKINGTIRTELTFVIDKDGKLVDYNAVGSNELFNNEAIKAAKAVNENTVWKPAMLDGKPVSYRFRLPIAMQFN